MTTTVADLALVAERLPAGWTVEHYTRGPGAHVIVKGAASIGCVTLDFERRGFRMGVSITGPYTGGAFRGHGWRERLVDDAVAALRGPEAKP